MQKSEDESMTPEQIVTMDWLADNVLGVIPTFSDLTDEARELVLLQGPLNLCSGESRLRWHLPRLKSD